MRATSPIAGISAETPDTTRAGTRSGSSATPLPAIFLAGALLTAPGAARAQTAPAPPPEPNGGAGRVLAEEVCAECHEITILPKVLSTDAPRSFVSIARDPAWSDAALKIFFDGDHAQMPDFDFTAQEVANLIAYFRTLGPGE